MKLNLAPMAPAVLLAAGCGWFDEQNTEPLVPLEHQLSATYAPSHAELSANTACTEDELRIDESDWTMLLVWHVLSTAATPEQLALVSRLAGFVAPDDDGDSTTVAYVHVTDDEGRAFQVSINVDTARDDEDELTLTNSSGDGGSTTSIPHRSPI